MIQSSVVLYFGIEKIRNLFHIVDVFVAETLFVGKWIDYVSRFVDNLLDSIVNFQTKSLIQFSRQNPIATPAHVLRIMCKDTVVFTEMFVEEAVELELWHQ